MLILYSAVSTECPRALWGYEARQSCGRVGPNQAREGDTSVWAMGPGNSASRSACAACQGSQRIRAFVDESIRRERYLMAAAAICECRLKTARRKLELKRRSGQSRLHMAKERPSRRREILSLVQSLPVGSVVVSAPGSDRLARAVCWTAIMPMLIENDVSELRIEPIDGQQHQDRHDIREALTKIDAVGKIRYQHQGHRDEPLLWVADAVVWAAGAGGDWARRITTRLIDAT